jgi:hypothetical protein
VLYTEGAAAAVARPFLDDEWEIVCLDPDVHALSAEVDAIMCAALRPRRCPPAPPATGCAVRRSCSASLPGGGGALIRRVVALRVDASQRGPPRRHRQCNHSGDSTAAALPVIRKGSRAARRDHSSCNEGEMKA